MQRATEITQATASLKGRLVDGGILIGSSAAENRRTLGEGESTTKAHAPRWKYTHGPGYITGLFHFWLQHADLARLMLVGCGYDISQRIR